MAHMETRAGNLASNRRLLAVALKNMAAMAAAIMAWQRAAARRRAMRDLTPDQLKDIGYPETPAPKLVVKAGLITNLMSMR